MLRGLSMAAGVVVAGLASGLAIGATPPPLGTGPSTAANREAEPTVSSPYWNGANSPYTSDLPAADLRAVPPAHAAAVHDKWTYQQSLFDLNNATRLLSLQLEQRPEYRQAVDDEQDAYDAMDNARQDALRSLQNNPEYTSAITLQRDLTQQIRDAHARPHPNYEQIEAMAQVKLDYVARNRQMEQQALADSEPYQQARQRYLQAAKQVRELRQANEMTVATNEDLVALRRQVADARIAQLTSNAYFRSAIRARNIALNYAAYYRSIDRYHPNYAGYGGYYSGYGYGGYVGYGR